jgi:hypothetical protein
MTGQGLTHSDAELVRVFCAELLLARRRAQQDELRSSTTVNRVKRVKFGLTRQTHCRWG